MTMRTYKYIYVIGVTLCLGLLLPLGGCSGDSPDSPDSPGSPVSPGSHEGTDPGHGGQPTADGRELRLSLGSHSFAETRATTLPSGYAPYIHAEALAPITQIQTYFTYQDGESGWKYVPTAFTYQKTAGGDDTWTSTVALKDGQYYLYGFMPKDNMGSSVTITAPEGGTFADGAVLTFKDLNVVSPDDICIIVGVKGYKDNDPPTDMTGRFGKYDYKAGNSDTGDGDNLYLLVDHLFAGLKFNMKIGEAYSELRHINVRSINLVPDNGGADVIESVTAKVTVNSSGMATPVFTDFKTGTNPNPAPLFEGDLRLTEAGVNLFGGLCPTTNTKFSLVTTYDVYDSKKKLIRKGETARNAISLEHAMTPGQIHTVNITVLPTYIYMLSDPDLDNPTFVVE